MTEPHRTVFRTPDGLDLVADRYGTPTRGGVLLAPGGGRARRCCSRRRSTCGRGAFPRPGNSRF